MNKVKTIVVIMCLAVGLMATGLFAAIVGTTGDIVEVAPPSSVMLGAVESNTQVIVFQEQDQIQLTSGIDVDISSPGTYFPALALSPWTIPAGTVVGSYFLHFDAASFSNLVTVDGSVTFECPIIGVSILTQQIDNSDSALGASGTIYPTGMWPNRGVTFEEYVTLSADMMTLSVYLNLDKVNDLNLDQIRVVTMCEPICGDGILDEGEECDDGNTMDGDGCSATCTVEDAGDGCTPGYWKNHLSAWAPTGLSPADDFDTTFGVDFFDPDITLEEAVNLRGGGIRKIGRHGTAALLNALHPDVNYPLDASEVIAAVQAMDLGGIVDFNELSDTCPAEMN